MFLESFLLLSYSHYFVMVITLIGYRGTGKSTVGEQLASRLDWGFVDTDQEIERTARKSIAEIFAEDGEPRFRDLERDELQRQLARENVVVSAGGGAILDDQSRQRMSAAGPVVWLQATVETIMERLQTDESTTNRRPSLTSSGIFDEVSDVLQQREPLYAEAASLIVSTNHRDIDSIVDEIVTQLPNDGVQC